MSKRFLLDIFYFHINLRVRSGLMYFFKALDFLQTLFKKMSNTKTHYPMHIQEFCHLFNVRINNIRNDCCQKEKEKIILYGLGVQGGRGAEADSTA